MSRKSIVDDKFAIVDRLKMIEEGKPVSRYLKDKLTGMGYLTMKESRQPGQRGQTSKSFEVSGKGRGYIALSNSWRRDK